MRHEGRECHARYTGGGARADATYRSWIRGFAEAVGRRRVVIVFEPDALGTLECLAKRRRAARLRTLAYGVDVLSRLPGATVYLDAGASDWQGVSRMAPKLRAIGIAKVRGFALNATHQDWTRVFLAAPTLLGVIDTYGIELIHPMREGRSPRQIGRKNPRLVLGERDFVLHQHLTDHIRRRHPHPATSAAISSGELGLSMTSSRGECWTPILTSTGDASSSCGCSPR